MMMMWLDVVVGWRGREKMNGEENEEKEEDDDKDVLLGVV